MSFFNPLGFLALLGIPLIIVMYILKEKHKEVKVPSSFLWKKAMASANAKKPWQKLRKNILMIIQIFAVIIIALVLAKPYIKGGKDAAHYIIVMDTSASMSSVDTQPTRFEFAKKEAEKIINNSSPDTYFTVISANNNPYALTEHTQGRENAISIIEKLNPSLESCDIQSTLEIIKTIKSSNDGNVYMFTDTGIDIGDITDMQVISVKSSDENTGITLLSENNGNVLVKVQNNGNELSKRNVTLYNDNNIIDVKEIEINGGETEDIYFDINTNNISSLKATLSPNDNYTYDDEYYYTINENTSKKAIVFSDNNIFIEKVFSVIPDVELYKGDKEFINTAEGYSLYIYDGVLPEKLPTDGHIMVFSPPNDNNIFKVLNETEVKDNASEIECEITENISDIDFAISKSKNIEIPNWGNVFLESGNTPIAFYGENNGQKNIVFCFDIYNSDLPLKMEFPIMMYNCTKYLFPERNTDISNIFTGDTVNFSLSPDTKEAFVTKPSGEKISVAPPFPVEVFTDTNENGIYKLSETNESGITNESTFSVNIVRDFINGENIDNTEETAVKKVSSTDKSLAGIFIILVIIALLAEWWVNCREN